MADGLLPASFTANSHKKAVGSSRSTVSAPAVNTAIARLLVEPGVFRALDAVYKGSVDRTSPKKEQQ
jgi:hypothetical protein